MFVSQQTVNLELLVGQLHVQFDVFSLINDELPDPSKHYIIGYFYISINSLYGIVVTKGLAHRAV